MSDTIESFVEKLQKDGVDAGQVEASKLLDGAKAEAEKVLSDAKTQAESITGDARAEAERIVKQGKDELALAGRDTLLRLHEVIVRAIRTILDGAVEAQMKDKEFLSNLIREVVVQYAQKDAEGDRPIEVRVVDEMLDALTSWAAGEMAGHGKGTTPDVALVGGLKAAGFEYSSSGGTVEVTPESVAAVLSGMVSPRLQEMIAREAKKKVRAAPNNTHQLCTSQ